MARPREPIELIVAKGKKHLTAEEIRSRRASEVAPCEDEIEAPSYLTADEKKSFRKTAEQLRKIKIMGETDVEALARYIVSEKNFEKATKDLRKIERQEPSEDTSAEEYYKLLALWQAAKETAARLQDRFFRQAQTAARDLGLTVSSRCRLVVPAREEPERVNKFSEFAAGKR